MSRRQSSPALRRSVAARGFLPAGPFWEALLGL